MASEFNEDIKKLLSLSLEINASTDHEVSVQSLGHVSGVTVFYFDGGYENNPKANFLCMCATESEGLESTFDKLNKMIGEQNAD